MEHLTSTVTKRNYSYFNPNGSFTADRNIGAGGATVKIGAILGVFTAGGPFFQFGYTDNLTLRAGSDLLVGQRHLLSEQRGRVQRVSLASVGRSRTVHAFALW